MPKLTRRSALALGAGAATALHAPALLAQARTRITIATGGTGGIFYPYGGGLAKLLSERAPGIQATAQVTGGGVDNIKLVQSGDAEIGFATMDTATDALGGVGSFEKEGKHDLRVLAVLYDGFAHLVASQASGVTKVADLKGKRVSVGAAGAATEVMADRMMAAAGLDPVRDVTRDNLSVAESVNGLKDGKIAAFFWFGGVPTAAVRDLATTGQPPIRFIPTSAEFAVLEQRHPGQYRPFLLQKGAYPGVTEEVQGVGVANVLIVSSKAKDATIDTVLNAVFGNLEEVHKIHPEARKLTLEAAANRTGVPFHPAAEAFYKARGAFK